jgi:hypothetical protein
MNVNVLVATRGNVTAAMGAVEPGPICVPPGAAGSACVGEDAIPGPLFIPGPCPPAGVAEGYWIRPQGVGGAVGAMSCYHDPPFNLDDCIPTLAVGAGICAPGCGVGLLSNGNGRGIDDAACECPTP